MTEIMNKNTVFELETDGRLCYSDSADQREFSTTIDYSKITYVVSPSGEKLRVIGKPSIFTCNICREKHPLLILERDRCVHYCKHYEGGNWIFTPFSAER